jgi:hypothetical protein
MPLKRQRAECTGDGVEAEATRVACEGLLRPAGRRCGAEPHTAAGRVSTQLRGAPCARRPQERGSEEAASVGLLRGGAPLAAASESRGTHSLRVARVARSRRVCVIGVRRFAADLAAAKRSGQCQSAPERCAGRVRGRGSCTLT